MTGDVISQDQIDQLMHLNEFIGSKKGATRQLIREMRSAILDSGKLSVDEWKNLRKGLREIEELLPVMDMIITLKERHESDLDS
jgi:hypothetical protein